MSFSVVNIVKLIGDHAVETHDACVDCAVRHALIESVNENAMDRDDAEMEKRIGRILENWGKITSVYSSRFIDNHSVGGSGIFELEKLLKPLNIFEYQIIVTRSYFLWFLTETERFNIGDLKKLRRRAVLEKGFAERWLLANIIEASLAWRIPNVKSVIAVVSEVLGPTLSDDEVMIANSIPGGRTETR